MNRIDKLKSISTIPADAEADIALINKHSVKKLTPQDVFCFSVILCDNEVDRDLERFTNASLDKLATLYLGKTFLLDHRWSAEKQVARIYRTFVEDMNENNSMGEERKGLRANVYMLRTDGTAELIKAIEGGIVKEVSIGCRVKECNCSICGKRLKLDWCTWTYQCETGHIKGEEYEGKMCVGNLEKPTEAFEASFVAVPSQRGAGVTKSVESMTDAVELLRTADCSSVKVEDKKELIQKLQMSLADDDERNERAKILADNKKFMEVE